MRILGIDYGDQRIGLALSDFTGTLVGRAWTLHEWGRAQKKAARLQRVSPKRRDLTSYSGTSGAAAWRRTRSCMQTAEKKKSTARVWTLSRQVSSLRAISVRWEVRLYDEAARRRSGRYLS